MSAASCSLCVRLCSSLREWPAAVLCTSLAVLQMAILDYYLVHYLGISHLTWLAFDAINTMLLILSIRQARTAINQYRKGRDITAIGGGSMGWVAWLFMSFSVALKSVVTFRYFSHHLDEATTSFFGANTLKTTIAMGSCTFLLLLITQHDMPSGSKGRMYIQELAGTVVFDILDTVDILQVLFDVETREELPKGLEEFILAVAVLNLVMPTIPLFLLAKSRFGQIKLSVKFVHAHRILLVLAVNMPNLIIRSMLWHGIATGVSPFTLKNILAIWVTFYEIYEHNKQQTRKYEHKVVNDTGHKSKKVRFRGHRVEFRISRSLRGHGSSGVQSQSVLSPKGSGREDNGKLYTDGTERVNDPGGTSAKSKSYSAPGRTSHDREENRKGSRKSSEFSSGHNRKSSQPLSFSAPQILYYSDPARQTMSIKGAEVVTDDDGHSHVTVSDIPSTSI